MATKPKLIVGDWYESILITKYLGYYETTYVSRIKAHHYSVQCRCGVEFEMPQSRIRATRPMKACPECSKALMHAIRKPKLIVGNWYESILITKYLGYYEANYSGQDKAHHYSARCECGREFEVPQSKIKSSKPMKMCSECSRVLANVNLENIFLDKKSKQYKPEQTGPTVDLFKMWPFRSKP